MTDLTTHHIGITVADLDASEHFWEQLLGTRSVRRYTIQGEFIETMSGYPGVVIRASQVNLPSGGYLELLCYDGHSEDAVDPETFNTGNVHLCLRADDARATIAKAIGLGAVPRSPEPVVVPSGANEGAVTGYLRTPDGVTLEIFQPPLP